MEPIAHLVKVSIPNYLAGLPIPESIGGWFRLGGKKLCDALPIYFMIECNHIREFPETIDHL